ncbi:MAG TPA: DUF2911 domain-containing protein [Thermoanaerobaculia bacterium]|nr:DUF2911 domain-containing protein [Thermoanaerobaculia bacterium]
MKRVPILILLAVALAVPAMAQIELPRVSPKATVSQTVGLTPVTIIYSRPGVKGREIFGGLVPYDRVWRTGANEATIVEFGDDVTINGEKLTKGTYSLHTIPGRDSWTLIFNREANQWGSYSYDAANDALRLSVRPRASDHPHELMTFSFPVVSADSAEVVLAWDRLEIPFTISVDTNAKVLADARSALDWRVPYQAANWAWQNEIDGADALRWVDQSIAIQESWPNLQLKARILAAQGKAKEAVAAGEKAVKVAKTAQNPPDTSALERDIAEWKRSR